MYSIRKPKGWIGENSLMKLTCIKSRWSRYVGVAILSSGLAGIVNAGPSFTKIGDLPGGTVYSRALGVSADGRVVVGSGTTDVGTVAFAFSDGVMVSLGIPAGKNGTVANAASYDGSTIVGTMSSAAGTEAFRYRNGVMSSLGDLPGGHLRSSGNSCSADGNVVVGTGWGFTGPLAYRWSGGVMTSLGDLPGGGIFSNGNFCSQTGSTAVGLGFSNNGPEACAWQGTPFGLGDLAGGAFNSVAYGCSADGTVIVGVGTSANGSEAFRYQGGVMVGLGDLAGGAFSSTANAVSGNGRIIVGSATNATGPVAFVWDAENGMRDLNWVLAANGVNLNGWKIREATGISHDGRVIVGTAMGPDGHIEAYTANVPVPGGVEATVALNGYVGDPSAIDFTVQIYNAGTNVLRETRVLRLDSQGTLILDTALRGSFDLYLQGGAFLRKASRSVNITAGGAGNVNFSMDSGDVDGDNEVTLVDYNLLRNALNSVDGDSNWNPNADLNGDGEVSLVDYGILSANFGKGGD